MAVAEADASLLTQSEHGADAVPATAGEEEEDVVVPNFHPNSYKSVSELLLVYRRLVCCVLDCSAHIHSVTSDLALTVEQQGGKMDDGAGGGGGGEGGKGKRGKGENTIASVVGGNKEAWLGNHFNASLHFSALFK